MADRFRFPGPQPREALAFWRAKDIRPAFSYKDAWGREHAMAFTVAKAAKLEVLDAIRESLDRALAEGRTFRAWAKDLEPELVKLGWWGRKKVRDPKTGRLVEAQLGSPRRLRVIHDANIRSARSAGQWDRVQRTKRTHPELLYQLGPSREHRDQHEAWAGTHLPVDHEWWNDHAPPNGWGCKCWLRQLSKREAARLDPKPAPRRRLRTFVNDRTGETMRVDKGLDPAWTGNPGRDRAAALRGNLVARTIEADDRLAAAAVRDVVQSPVLDDMLAAPQGEIPVAVLSRSVRNALGAETSVVRLGAKAVERSGLATADWRRIPEVVAKASAGDVDGARVRIAATVAGQVFRATLRRRSAKAVEIVEVEKGRN